MPEGTRYDAIRRSMRQIGSPACASPAGCLLLRREIGLAQADSKHIFFSFSTFPFFIRSKVVNSKQTLTSIQNIFETTIYFHKFLNEFMKFNFCCKFRKSSQIQKIFTLIQKCIYELKKFMTLIKCSQV